MRQGRALAVTEYAEGEILGYVVVTWPQTGGQPDIDAPGLDDWDTACLERDDRRKRTRDAGRGEQHEVAAVIRDSSAEAASQAASDAS